MIRNIDRYKDIEKHREYQRKWHQSYLKLNREKENERYRFYYKRNKERIKPLRRIWLNKYRKDSRNDVLLVYGGNPPKCACCGETIIEFLTIDHIDGNGAKHRKLHTTAVHIYTWLKRHNYPKGFQVLCMNCNTAKGRLGKCPHQKR